MTFGTLMSGLFKVKELFPSMRWEATSVAWGESFVTITIPCTDENAQLLIDAQAMFAPRDGFSDY